MAIRARPRRSGAASPEDPAPQSFCLGDRHYSCTCPSVGEGGLCHFRFAFVDPDFLELAQRACSARCSFFFSLVCVGTEGSLNQTVISHGRVHESVSGVCVRRKRPLLPGRSTPQQHAHRCRTFSPHMETICRKSAFHSDCFPACLCRALSSPSAAQSAFTPAPTERVKHPSA